MPCCEGIKPAKQRIGNTRVLKAQSMRMCLPALCLQNTRISNALERKSVEASLVNEGLVLTSRWKIFRN